MKVELDPDAIQELLDLWGKVIGMGAPMPANVHALNNRRALLTNHKRTATTFALMMEAMTPADDAPEFAALKASVGTFRTLASAELGKLAELE